MIHGTSPIQPQIKHKADSKAAIDSNNEIIPPVDFSFCRIENIADAKMEEPRPPVTPRGKGRKTEKEPEGAKSIARCLKLNNNSITNLECLVDFVQTKFTNWQEMAWIDLSHNELTKIGPELTEFVNLQILYLHGNQIQDQTHIEQLAPLKRLRKLTLHGNPIENMKGYRFFVLLKLPQLQCLDFTCVTKADRRTSYTLGTMNSWGVKKKTKAKEVED